MRCALLGIRIFDLPRVGGENVETFCCTTASKPFKDAFLVCGRIFTMMKRSRRSFKPTLKTKMRPIKTSFLELLSELTLLTKDDRLVIAVLKNIFASHKVRFGRALAPVRLTANSTRLKLRRRRPAWA